MLIRKVILYLLLFLCFVLNSSSGVSQLNSALYNDLKKIHPTSPIHSFSNQILPSYLVDSFFNNSSHDLYFVDSDYVISLDGTGKLYKMNPKKDSLIFTRFDATSFAGYNFGDIKFSWKNKMYSYGGYGYWRNNGLIRRFNSDNGQWDLMQLEKEIPAVDIKTFTWLDSATGQLYVYNPVPLNEGLMPVTDTINSMRMQVWSIDLNSGKCLLLGTGYSLDFTKLVESPFGILCNKNYAELIMMDLKGNRFFNLSKEFTQNYFKVARNIIPDIFLFEDSSFYMMNSKTGLFDSIHLHQGDLINAEHSVYNPPSSTSTTQYYLLLLIILIIVTIVVLIYRFRRKKFIHESDVTYKALSLGDKSIQVFEEKELQLLNLFCDKHFAMQGITIEDLNFVLGIKHKNESVQKKNRSEVLQKLNLKLMMLLEVKEDILVKKRVSEDKRSFTYHINSDYLDSLLKVLNKDNLSSK